MKTTTKVLISFLIGIIVFPTFTLGGTFVYSLIQGKTVEEAVQILTRQMDVLIGRVGVVEDKQAVQEAKITELEEQKEEMKEQIQEEMVRQDTQQVNEELCRDANRLLYLIPPHEPNSGTGKYFGRPGFPNSIVDLYDQIVKGINSGQNYNPDGVGTPVVEPVVEEYYQNYLLAKEKCKLL